jgi:crotonobetainyl-CoA:carnitine CoA-transferase CaiB-like acyl-CoA transferase
MQDLRKLPLAGVRVIDFGQQIAGPGVAMTLADLGASVVHIDPPNGPQWKHPANAILNRNKSCLRLDLKSEQGLLQALLLIEQADVVLESFRPGVIQRLGIDFHSLRVERPELITLSIPGFASNDELRQQWKATESIVAATSGAYTDMGLNRVLMGINPSYSPLPLGSSYAISLATSAVVFALLQREKNGLGDAIEVPICAALMEGLSYNSYVVDKLPDRYKTMREHEIERRKASGQAFDLSYSDLQEYLDPFFRSYICADDRMFYCVCPSHRNHAKRALKALGIYDELIAQGLPEVTNLHLPISEWDGETSIGVYPLPKKWADIIASKMKQAFLTKTSEQWGDIFGEQQIPGAAHRTTQEWVNSEHCLKSGLIVEVDDPEYGLMKQPGPIAWLEEYADLMLNPTPRKTVSFDEALAFLSEIAHQESLIHSLPTPPSGNQESDTLWLEGVRILDLTNVIAGPHSCAFMARFGACVTKLDPVTPLYDPLIGTLFSFQSDMGKQKALVDITTDEGREIFNRLIKNTDMVVINAPQRQLKSLGLDWQTLQSINPDVQFCRLDCFGGPLIGPKTNHIGYDDIIQANSGIMSRFGEIATPEEHAHIGTLDVNCGFAAGLAMAVALYHKQRTGKRTRARTSLSAVTNVAQLPFAFDYQGRDPFNEASGRSALGNHPLSHFYKTSDHWVFIDSNLTELESLNNIEALQGISQASDIQQFLKQAFSQAPAQYWVSKFSKADIAIAQPHSIEYLRKKYTRVAVNTDEKVPNTHGSFAFITHPHHPSNHQLTQVEHYAIRPTEAVIKAISPAQSFGYSTREILADVGYSDIQIDSLIESNIAATHWGKQYLPC